MRKDAYSKLFGTHIFNILYSIKQEGFKLISEYREAVHYCIQRLGVSRRFNKREIDQKIEETFVTTSTL